MVLIHGHDDASNHIIFLSFQPVVSYGYNDIYIFHTDLMQNHNFQIALSRAQGEEVKMMRVVSCYWPSSLVTDPAPSFQPGRFMH